MILVDHYMLWICVVIPADARYRVGFDEIPSVSGALDSAVPHRGNGLRGDWRASNMRCLPRHYNRIDSSGRCSRVCCSSSAAAQFDALHDVLHRIAAAQMRREQADHTLSATALMHEAYLSLARSKEVPMAPAQFSALASRVMRNVLVNHALARTADKRGGGVAALSLTQAMLPDSRDRGGEH